ncbi:MAG: hypothetical protein HYZ26_05340 [Chloroflexi bacterium]|nr:hypothetical protein [Chloroflexota bacterium]
MRIDESSAYVNSAFAGVIIEEYRGILFRVENVRRHVARRQMRYEDFPIGVRQRFATCPNFIEIDTNIRLYDLQREIGDNLKNWIASKGRKAYIRAFKDEYLDIIETAYNDPAEKADQIHKLLLEFSPADGLEELNLSQFPQDFMWLLPQMHPDTINALKTAEMINSALPDLPDSSAVVIEYCKAVEIELSEKLLKPARSHWAIVSAGISPTHPKELEKLKKFLSGNSPKPLELGTMGVMLEAASKHVNNPVSNSLLLALKDLPLSDESPLVLVRDIFYLTQNFRNLAAHKSILSKQQAMECRDFVIGTASKHGLLFKILKAV